MFSSIEFWVSVSAIIVSVFSVIVIFLTRNNILDILDKDVILFDKNFELKKSAIEQALKLTDELHTKGEGIKNDEVFKQSATKCYNDLLCVVTHVKLADEFYALTLKKGEEITEVRLAQFKIMCRKDIGLKTNGAKLVKRTMIKDSEINTFNNVETPQEKTYEPLKYDFAPAEPEVKPVEKIKTEETFNDSLSSFIATKDEEPKQKKTTKKPAGRPKKK